jgi:hypothetical protein
MTPTSYPLDVLCTSVQPIPFSFLGVMHKTPMDYPAQPRRRRVYLSNDELLDFFDRAFCGSQMRLRNWLDELLHYLSLESSEGTIGVHRRHQSRLQQFAGHVAATRVSPLCYRRGNALLDYVARFYAGSFLDFGLWLTSLYYFLMQENDLEPAAQLRYHQMRLFDLIAALDQVDLRSYERDGI